MKAVFLDRDGTLIIDKHYLYKPDEVEYFTDTQQALELLQAKGYQLFIVTNQSGIGRGWFTHNDVLNVHQKMQADLASWNLQPYIDLAYSPEAPDQPSDRRKPAPGMILELLQKYPTIDPQKSYMVGDRVRDAQCGHNAGINGALVYFNNTSDSFPVFPNLLSFAKFIC